MQVKFHFTSDSKKLSKTVPYEKGDTLLDTAIKNDIPAPYSCMEGVCQTCEAKVLSGKVDVSTDDELSTQTGTILTCQAKPLAEETLVEIEY